MLGDYIQILCPFIYGTWASSDVGICGVPPNRCRGRLYLGIMFLYFGAALGQFTKGLAVP